MATEERVLVVDDKLELAETLADSLSDRGYTAWALRSSREALSVIENGAVDLVITDLRMPELDGLALVTAARNAGRDLPIIVMTAYGAVDSAIDSMRRGAFHYLTKPFKAEELLGFVERALAEARRRREASTLGGTRATLAGFVGASAAMQAVRELVARVAKTDTPLLVTGETGTGKSALARAVHGESTRAAGPFIAVNCAAIPEPLLESELFGHVRGAFTGATTDRVGLFEAANHGTLLLDEIAEMSPPLQAKLLHVLESRTIRAVGASGERPIDVRVVAATHRDLRQRVEDGSFRLDLLYRLDLIAIEMPALRARRSDIPGLLAHFLAPALTRYPMSLARRFSRDALARLIDYAWPGNVRELAHVVERCVVLGAAEQIGEPELPSAIRGATPPSLSPFSGDVIPMRQVQRRYARWALEQIGGQKIRTAERLGVDIKTLNRWLALDSDDD